MAITRQLTRRKPEHVFFENLESRLLLTAQPVSTWDMFPLIDNTNYVYHVTDRDKPGTMTGVEHFTVRDNTVQITDTIASIQSTGTDLWRIEHTPGGLDDGIYIEKRWGDDFSFKFAPTMIMGSTLTPNTKTYSNGRHAVLGTLSFDGFGTHSAYLNVTTEVGDWQSLTVEAGTFTVLPVSVYCSVFSTANIYIEEAGRNVNVDMDVTFRNTYYLVKGLGSVKFEEYDTASAMVDTDQHTEDQAYTGTLVRSTNVPTTLPYFDVKSVQYKSGVFDNTKPFTISVNDVYRTINVNNENYQVSAVLSRDKIWGNADDIVIQSGQSFTPLVAGSAQKLTISSSLDPALIAPGNYYVGLRFDDGTTLAVNDATSNIWWSAKADVNVLNIVDLRATNQDLLASETTAGQSADLATYRISRVNNNSNAPLTVAFSVSGTATRGRDYVLQVNGQTITGNTVTIAAGAMFADIVLVPIDDAIVEKAETVKLTLKPNNKTFGADMLNSTTTFSLADLTVPIVSVKTTRNTAEQYDAQPKNYGAFTFTRVGGDLTKETSVLVQLAGGATPTADYILKNANGETITINNDGTANITFAAGAKTAIVTVVPVNDILNEGPELLELTILPAAGEVTYRPDIKAANTKAVIKISDNDIAVDALSGTQIVVTATAKDDATGAKYGRNGRMYMGDADYVEQLKNAIAHGTYTMVKTGGNSITLTAKDDVGVTSVYELTFTSATTGRLTGTETIDGLTLTLSGSFSLAVSKLHVPDALAGRILACTVTGSDVKTDIGGKSTLAVDAGQITVTASGEQSVETYEYKISANLGFLKRVDGSSHVTWSVLVFSTGKTHTYLTVKDPLLLNGWEIGRFIFMS